MNIHIYIYMYIYIYTHKCTYLAGRYALQNTAIHCNTLQHTATRLNLLICAQLLYLYSHLLYIYTGCIVYMFCCTYTVTCCIYVYMYLPYVYPLYICLYIYACCIYTTGDCINTTIVLIYSHTYVSLDASSRDSCDITGSWALLRFVGPFTIGEITHSCVTRLVYTRHNVRHHWFVSPFAVRGAHIYMSL